MSRAAALALARSGHTATSDVPVDARGPRSSLPLSALFHRIGQGRGAYCSGWSADCRGVQEGSRPMNPSSLV
jgi:hypothetical protein